MPHPNQGWSNEPLRTAADAPWRWNSLGGWMVTVLGFALIFSLVAQAAPVAVLLVWPTLISGLSIPLGRWLGCSRFRAGVWLCAAYPWLGIALVAGSELSAIRRTLPALGPALEALRVITLGGLMAIMAWGPLLALAELLLTLERGGPNTRRQAALLVLIPLGSWLGAATAFALLVPWL